MMNNQNLLNFIGVPFVLLTMMLTTTAQASDAGAELSQRLQEIKTLHGEFTQKQIDARGKVIDESKGSLDALRPNHFHFETLQPAKQVIVADGKKLWVYDADLNQVTVSTQQKSLGTTPAELLSGDPAKLIQKFEVHHYTDFKKLASKTQKQYSACAKLTASTKNAYCLRARTPDDLVQSIALSFDEKLPQQMIIADQLNQLVSMSFNKITINNNLPGNLFVFKKPAGVEVIEQGK